MLHSGLAFGVGGAARCILLIVMVNGEAGRLTTVYVKALIRLIVAITRFRTLLEVLFYIFPINFIYTSIKIWLYIGSCLKENSSLKSP